MTGLMYLYFHRKGRAMKRKTLEQATADLTTMMKGRDVADLARVKATYLKQAYIVDEDGDPIDAEQLDITIEPHKTSDDPDEKADDEAGDKMEDEEKAISDLVDRRVKAALEKAAKKGVKRTPWIGNIRDRSDDDRSAGFKSAGHFAHEVMKMAGNRGPSEVMQKWVTKTGPSSSMNEGSLADGGALVPPEYADRILEHVLSDVDILPRTDQYTLRGNTIEFPAHDNPDWEQDKGVSSSKTAEGGQKGQSIPELEMVGLKLRKETVIVPATDEMLEDASLLEQFITREGGRKIRWKVNNKLYRGNGVGEALGVINSPATLTQAASGVSTSIQTNDIIKMFARMPEEYIAGAVWMYNRRLLDQLLTLKIGDTPVMMMPGGMNERPYSSILGVPAISSEHCSAVNTVGDISLINWSQYITATKANALQTAMSIHLWFDYDVTAFRFVFRYDGQPWFKRPIPAGTGDANETMSAFVTLGVRADNT